MAFVIVFLFSGVFMFIRVWPCTVALYVVFFFFQAEDGIRDRSPSRGLGDVYKRQIQAFVPDALVKRYCAAMEALFGPGCCYLLSLREQGAVRVM